MPRETALVIAAICVPFIVFAIALAWADFTSHSRKS